MKKRLFFVILLIPLALCVAPVATFAYTYMNSDTESSSNTGGNTVSSGGYVDNGASYSSVSVENVVGGSGGSSTVQIQTDNNGHIQTQTITKPVPPNGVVDIDVATSTGGGSTSVHIESNTSSNDSSGTASLSHALNKLFRVVASMNDASTTASTSAAVFASTSIQQSPSFAAQIAAFFSSFFSMFSFW